MNQPFTQNYIATIHLFLLRYWTNTLKKRFFMCYYLGVNECGKCVCWKLYECQHEFFTQMADPYILSPVDE